MVSSTVANELTGVRNHKFSEISDREFYCLLGCNAVGYFGYVPTFQRNLLSQSLDRVHHDCEATYSSETSALN